MLPQKDDEDYWGSALTRFKVDAIFPVLLCRTFVQSKYADEEASMRQVLTAEATNEVKGLIVEGLWADTSGGTRDEYGQCAILEIEARPTAIPRANLNLIT